MDEVPWSTLERLAPELTSAGMRLLYRDQPLASALLGTTAPDLGPRVHPVFPIVALGDLWLFIVEPSPKYRDLRRNGWFALHSTPAPAEGEEFLVRGHAAEVDDERVRARIVAATGHRQGGQPFERLFRCGIRQALHTRWESWGTEAAWPAYTKWPSA